MFKFEFLSGDSAPQGWRFKIVVVYDTIRMLTLVYAVLFVVLHNETFPHTLEFGGEAVVAYLPNLHNFCY